MTRRNYQNERYKNDIKGTARKSSSSAKPKSKAGNSVVTGKAAPSKEERRRKRDEETRKAQEKLDRAVAKGGAEAAKAQDSLNNYKKYRNMWLAFILLAVVAIAFSWGASILMDQGKALEEFNSMRNPLRIGGMVLGYVGIIAALVVDFKFMRPIRKLGKGIAKVSKKSAKHDQERAAEGKKGFFKK